MHNVTQNFLNTIKLPNRGFKSTVKIRDTIFDDTNIIEMSLEENVNPADSFMLGSVASNKLEVTLINVPNILILENAIVNPNLSLLVGSNYEDVPLGVFTVDEISKDKSTVKLICYDNMIKLEKTYFSNLSYPSSINSVAQEICSKAGVQLATTLPSTLINKIEGYTYREAISFIASFLGGFARFNRIGKLEIVSYGTTNIEVTGDNYFKLTTNEKPFTIGRLACQVGENIIPVGASGNEIKFENPIMTQVQLNNIFNNLKALSYMPYSMDWQGNPALMAGDKIKIIDVKGNTYNTLLMQQKLSYKGGLSSTSKAVGKTEQAQEFSSSGGIKNKVERVVIEQANIKSALIEKATIEDLTVVNARIDNLYTTDLIAVNAKITNLEVHKADVIKLNAETARINDLYATKGTIENLNATNGKITLLETKVGSIDTILSKEIFAELISAGKIVAGSSIIAESAIGSAQINSLDLNKLNAGSIDTSKIQLIGPNGRLKLVGNKLQIFDTVNGQQFERVMLGVDDSNNSTIVLRGADGKTILLNQDGLTKPGFTDGYNKLEDNSLPGTKLDINSVMRGMNEKGTETIKGTKVSIGDRTLDVELSTQKNLIDGANKELSTQKATVSAMDNAIKLKVDNQTFNTFKSTTDGNIVTVTTNLNKATSSIDVLQKSIALKVSQTDIDKSIKELEIGGRNYVRRLGGETYDTESIYPADKQWVKYTMTRGAYGLKTWIVYDGFTALRIASIPIENNTTYTWSFIIYTDGESKNISCHEWDGTNYGRMSYGISKVPKRISHTFTSKENSAYEILHIKDLSPTDSYYLADFKLEKGTKATDWTPAPEDIDQAINTVDTKINTKVGEINVSLDGVTTRVGKTESASTVIDGKINSLTTRVTNAETKLTDSSIISTVRNSTAYKGDLNGKANQTALTTAESKIVQLADLISHKVESKDFASYRTQTDKAITDRVGSKDFLSYKTQTDKLIAQSVGTKDFNTYKTQTATELGQRVTKGEFSSYFKQNADSFNFGFNSGSNLLRDSGRYINTRDYLIATYHISKKIKEGTRVTIAIKGSLGAGKEAFGVYNSGGWGSSQEITASYRTKDGVYVMTFDWWVGSTKNTELYIYQLQNSVVVNSIIEWVTLVEGNVAVNWSETGEFNNTSVTITDKDGLVVRNNAISVVSKSGRTAFKVDDEGYIMNEWGVSTRVKPGSTISVAGKVMADDKCSTLLRAFGIWHESIDSKYNMRIGSKSEIWFKNLADEFQDIRTRWTMSNQFRTTYNNDAGVILRENTVDSGTGRLWINWGGGRPGHIAQTLVGDGMQAGSYGELHCGSFYSHGQKNRAVETESFGTRALCAYETATPYFGDISRQAYAIKDGQCIVPIDTIFKETITDTGEYQVFITKYGPGDIWVSEMYPTYFIVKGANIKFSWELKAIQRGYENNRLEQVQI